MSVRDDLVLSLDIEAINKKERDLMLTLRAQEESLKELLERQEYYQRELKKAEDTRNAHTAREQELENKINEIEEERKKRMAVLLEHYSTEKYNEIYEKIIDLVTTITEIKRKSSEKTTLSPEEIADRKKEAESLPELALKMDALVQQNLEFRKQRGDHQAVLDALSQRLRIVSDARLIELNKVCEMYRVSDSIRAGQETVSNKIAEIEANLTQLKTALAEINLIKNDAEMIAAERKIEEEMEVVDSDEPHTIDFSMKSYINVLIFDVRRVGREDVAVLLEALLNEKTCRSAFLKIKEQAEKTDDTLYNFFLINCYWKGIGTRKKTDRKTLFNRQEALAKRGCYIAMTGLAEDYAENIVIPRDIKKAMHWYETATNQTQFYYPYLSFSQALVEGHGIPRDIPRGLALMRKAAEVHPTAAMFLGNFYLDVLNSIVAYNADQGLALLQKAAEKGENTAKLRLARHHLQDKDPAKYFKLLSECVDSGDAAAECELGFCLQYGLPEVVEANPARAFTLFTCAINQGYSDALEYFHKFVMRHGSQPYVALELPKLIARFRKGYLAGDPVHLVNLGFCYQHGLGVKQELARAVMCYRRAADLGDEFASEQLEILAQAASTAPGLSETRMAAAAASVTELSVARLDSAVAVPTPMFFAVRLDPSAQLSFLYSRNIDTKEYRDLKRRLAPLQYALQDVRDLRYPRHVPLFPAAINTLIADYAFEPVIPPRTDVVAGFFNAYQPSSFTDRSYLQTLDAEGRDKDAIWEIARMITDCEGADEEEVATIPCNNLPKPGGS